MFLAKPNTYCAVANTLADRKEAALWAGSVKACRHCDNGETSTNSHHRVIIDELAANFNLYSQFKHCMAAYFSTQNAKKPAQATAYGGS
ncbi:hypothetical protein HLB35_04395 [Halomonas sp. TBZ9]|uniref:Uncharacterized protein n=1 Tax=Vreelandella azerica TaxID=2732867 RepID=A0A7Y3TVT7_9GAMM|nr:hypothetical protein [Halomonas azerica]NOG31196.1 hypothetical protein [Halomonas azerica]